MARTNGAKNLTPGRKRDQSKLTPKEEIFVREYLIDMNASRAAQAAGYSERTSAEQASVLLKMPRIKAAVQRLNGRRIAKLDMSGKDVLQKLMKYAGAEMSNYLEVDEDGLPKFDFSACTKEMLDCIGEISTETVLEGKGEDVQRIRKVKFKLVDRLRALELLAKHHGLLQEKVDVTSGGQPFKALISVDLDRV